jgi:hypothetical protein
VVFINFTISSVLTENSRLAKVVLEKFALAAGVRSAVRNNKQAVELSVHQDGGRPSTSSIAEITNNYPASASAVQQVCRVFVDIENLAGSTTTKVGEALSGPLLWIVWRRTEQTL